MRMSKVLEQYGNVVLHHVRRNTGMNMNSRMKERSEFDASNLCRVVCVCVCVCVCVRACARARACVSE